MELSVSMSEIGENIDQGIVTRVAVEVGEEILPGQTLIEVESDKVILEVPAEHSGVVRQLLVTEGDNIKPGEYIAVIAMETPEKTAAGEPATETTGRKSSPVELPSPAEPAAAAPPSPQLSTPTKNAAAYAGPAAHRLARELGVRLDRILGTGEGGRISRDDIKSFVRNNQGGHSQLEKLSLPDFSGITPVRRESLEGIGRTAAGDISKGRESVPRAWLQVKADISRLEAFRNEFNEQAASGDELNLTAYFLKSLALSLQEFPRFNACFDEPNNELLIKEQVHISLAVDTEHGRLTPVLRDVDRLPLQQLSTRLRQIIETARLNQLSPEQLQGGGMTLSALGGSGVEELSPLVNWPELAILGIGAIVTEPVWGKDSFIPHSLVKLTLGFDRRIIKRAEGASFLKYFKMLLEEPFLFALH